MVMVLEMVLVQRIIYHGIFDVNAIGTTGHSIGTSGRERRERGPGDVGWAGWRGRELD